MRGGTFKLVMLFSALCFVGQAMGVVPPVIP